MAMSEAISLPHTAQSALPNKFKTLAEYAKVHPKQFVETGIAEQNIVSIAAGLAACGKKAYVASPACFLSTRSMEQAKVDVAYSNTNVKLVGSKQQNAQCLALVLRTGNNCPE